MQTGAVSLLQVFLGFNRIKFVKPEATCRRGGGLERSSECFGLKGVRLTAAQRADSLQFLKKFCAA